VWERCHLYDPSRGNVSTFASRVAGNAFADTLAELGYPARLPLYLVEGTAQREAAGDAVIAAAGAVTRAPVSAGRRPGESGVDIEAEGDDIAGDLDRAANLARICSLRCLLTRRERRVLAMRFRLGLTQKQIGRWMGVTGEAVRQSEGRAIAKL